jgi:hypothetical protein
MPDSPTEVTGSMMLCDTAQSVGGKLYILGGGWTQVSASAWPGVLGLAITIAVPWDRTNEPMPIRAVLVTTDDEPVAIEGTAVEARANFEIGRPPGARRGMPMSTTMALNFQGLKLEPGVYVWLLEVEGGIRARQPFRVTA